MTHSSFLPEPPKVTLAELREENPEMYEVYKKIIDHYATDVYHNSEDGRNYGLESCMETTETLIEKGWIRPLWNEDTGDITMGCFNTETGKYDLQEEGY